MLFSPLKTYELHAPTKRIAPASGGGL